jgi:hypothetical protein
MRDANLGVQIDFHAATNYPIRTLRIRDARSRLTILEVEVNADQLMEILGAQTAGTEEPIPAWFTGHADKIGKHHVHVTALWKAGWKPRVTDEENDAWAERVRVDLGATSASISQHNRGRTGITLRHYMDTEESAAHWKQNAQQMIDDLVRTAPGYAEPASDE